jgi:iron transport multicopper oxidase
LDEIPDTLNPNATAYLVYNKSSLFPNTPILQDFDPFDDIELIPLDQEPLFENPDNSFQLTVVMNDLDDGAN